MLELTKVKLECYLASIHVSVQPTNHIVQKFDTRNWIWQVKKTHSLTMFAMLTTLTIPVSYCEPALINNLYIQVWLYKFWFTWLVILLYLFSSIVPRKFRVSSWSNAVSVHLMAWPWCAGVCHINIGLPPPHQKGPQTITRTHAGSLQVCCDLCIYD